jgi:hypothetical protein
MDRVQQQNKPGLAAVVWQTVSQPEAAVPSIGDQCLKAHLLTLWL